MIFSKPMGLKGFSFLYNFESFLYIFFLFFSDTVRYLLDNHLVDVTSIILSEGVPLMKNTLRPNANRTHSLHFGDDGSLHSNYVQNR